MDWDINTEQLESSSDSEGERKRRKINRNKLEDERTSALRESSSDSEEERKRGKINRNKLERKRVNNKNKRKDKEENDYYSRKADVLSSSDSDELMFELPKRKVKKNKTKLNPKNRQLKVPDKVKNKIKASSFKSPYPYSRRADVLSSSFVPPSQVAFHNYSAPIINEDEQRINVARAIIEAIENDEFDEDYNIQQALRMDTLGESFGVYVVEGGKINNLGPNFLYILVIPNVGTYDIPPEGHRVKFSTYDINSQSKQNVRQLDIEPDVGFKYVYISGYLVLFFYGQESKIKTPQKPHDDDQGFLSRIGNSLFNTAFNYVKKKWFKK